MVSLRLNITSTVVVLLLTIHWTQSSNTDVRCDPDVPSRPQPEPDTYPVALAQGDNLPTECPEGEYLDWYKCLPCKDGTYRTKQMAAIDKYSRCEKCQTPVTYEIVAAPCTTRHDAKIMCEDGFYRYEVPGKPCQSECIRCDICGVGKNMFKEYVGEECNDYNNTVCCPMDNMAVVERRCLEKTTISTTSTTTVTTTRTSTIASVTSFTPGAHAAEQNQQRNHSRKNCIAILYFLFCIIVSNGLT